MTRVKEPVVLYWDALRLSDKMLYYGVQSSWFWDKGNCFASWPCQHHGVARESCPAFIALPCSPVSLKTPDEAKILHCQYCSFKFQILHGACCHSYHSYLSDIDSLSNSLSRRLGTFLGDRLFPLVRSEPENIRFTREKSCLWHLCAWQFSLTL